MMTFRVDDMTCGHCAGTITQALKAADPDAQVGIDLGRHLVQVESATRGVEALSAILADAGFTPVAVQAPTAASSPARGGCCGGCA